MIVIVCFDGVNYSIGCVTDYAVDYGIDLDQAQICFFWNSLAFGMATKVVGDRHDLSFVSLVEEP